MRPSKYTMSFTPERGRMEVIVGALCAHEDCHLVADCSIWRNSTAERMQRSSAEAYLEREHGWKRGADRLWRCPRHAKEYEKAQATS